MRTSTTVVLGCAAAGFLVLALVSAGLFMVFRASNKADEPLGITYLPVTKTELRQGTFIHDPEQVTGAGETGVPNHLLSPDTNVVRAVNSLF